MTSASQWEQQLNLQSWNQVYKKSALLQNTEDGQNKLLVIRESGFSASGLWMALGFELMGFKATIFAQVAQLEDKKAVANKNAAKKADDLP